MVDVPPPIFSEARIQKSKCQVQAEMKNTASLPRCDCHLCLGIQLEFGLIEGQIILSDKMETETTNTLPDISSFSPPDLLVCPYKNSWVDQYTACCCTTIHEHKKECSQTKVSDKSYRTCLCPRCCKTCMYTITLKKNSYLKEDCPQCARKFYVFIPCVHYRGFC